MPDGLENIIYRLVGQASGARDLVKEANAKMDPFYKELSRHCSQDENYVAYKCDQAKEIDKAAFKISIAANQKLQEFLEKLDKLVTADGKVTVAELNDYLTKSCIDEAIACLGDVDYGTLCKKINDLMQAGKGDKVVIDYAKSKYYVENDYYQYSTYKVDNLDNL